MKEKSGKPPLSDAGQRVLLVGFLVVWTAVWLFLHQSAFLSRYLPIWIRLAFFGGVRVMAMIFFKAGHAVVRHATRPDRVETTGAFRYVRHPLFAASLLTCLGLTVATGAFVSLAVFGGIFLFRDFIAGYEEKLLEDEFKDDYRSYKDKTGKWIPTFFLPRRPIFN